MPEYGIKLMTEVHGPAELLRQARLAEDHGLSFAGISDHYLPWLSDHEHAPFAWSVLGALGTSTSLDLTTMVTCPIIRYHPALVAQMAATVGVMANGRFRLGLGAGEQLNEHVYGDAWPAPDVRHDMLAEAIAVMRELWTGEQVTMRGSWYDVDRARVYDLPDDPIEVLVAVSGPSSVALAAESADGLVANEPTPELVEGWVDGGGDRAATWTEVPMAWAPTREAAMEQARRRFRFGTLGWPVMSELPDPRNFDAATASVEDEDMAEAMPCGPDPEPYVETFREFLDAGFEHLAVLPVGEDVGGTLRFFAEEVRPHL